MTGQRPPAPAPSRTSAAATAGPADVARRSGRDRAADLLPRRSTATTPRRLGLARLVHLGLALVLGVGSVAVAVQLDQREAQAEVHGAQYVRTATLETRLLTAHAAASRASLSGNAAQAEQAQAALDEAATQVVEAAAQPTGDEAALATISHHLLRYTEALERAELQRGSAQGRTALAAAHDVLREDLLPAVQELQRTHSAVSTSGVAWWMWLLPVLGWLTVAVILGISWYTARVSRRVVNPGLAIAAAATLVLAISSGSVVAGHNSGTAGSAAALFGDVQARTTAQRNGVGAFALLANGVATRSWSSQDATDYTTALDEAGRLLEDSGAEPAGTALTGLRRANEQVAAAAADRNWDKADELLQKSGANDPATVADRFLDASEVCVQEALDGLREAVRSQGAQTVGFAALALFCALISAAAGAWGIGQRLKEYR